MILKAFTPASHKLGIQALINRLHPKHPQQEKLQNEYNRFNEGDIGEQYILEMLQQIKLSPDTRILHNIQLDSFVKIQIDILIITNHYLLILEIKNIKGEVQFTFNPRQMIRTLNAETKIFTSPEIKIEQYVDGLSDLLRSHNLYVPIYSVIVFAFNNANITKPSEKIPVIMGHELPNFIKKIPRSTQSIESDKLANIILNNHTNRNSFPLCTYYEINPDQLLNGVFCPTCAAPNMIKLEGIWHCPHCNTKSTNAHQQALTEYYMLISPTINCNF